MNDQKISNVQIGEELRVKDKKKMKQMSIVIM